METGAASFGQKGQYGILTKSDAARLIRMAIKGAQQVPEEGYAVRQLIRRMRAFIGYADAVMLAAECEQACGQKKEWGALAQELRSKAEGA